MCLSSVFLNILAGKVIFFVAEAAANLDFFQIGKGFVELFIGEAGECVEESASFTVAGVFRKEIIEEVVFNTLQNVGHDAFQRQLYYIASKPWCG